MSFYKLVATDLDGTLFDSCGNISAENYAAIRSLRAAGVAVVPATGRTLGDLPRELTSCEDIRYILHSNGAVLYDKLTGERYVCGLTKSILARTLEVLRRYDVHLTVRAEGISYIDAAMTASAALARYAFPSAHANILASYSKSMHNFTSWVEGLEEAEMLCVFFRDAEEHAECRRHLEKQENIQVVAAAPLNLEIVHRDAGKGAALHRLADRLAIDHAQTVCVGDSENDVPLLTAAGLALAVANACPLLKNVCDEVICSNDEHAIAYIAKHYFGV